MGTIRRKGTTTPPPLPLPVKPPRRPKPPPVVPVPVPSVGVTLGSYGNASIDQWDATFVAASAAVVRTRGVRVDPRFLKAMMDVETGGDGTYPPTRCRPSDGYDSVPACGPMQIKWAYHQQRCPECDAKTVAGQVEMAGHIIGMTMLERGRDEYDALVTTYFPGGDVNGTSQAAYVNRVRMLVGIMALDGTRTTTTPAPAPTITRQQVVDIIGGGVPVTADTFGFNERNPGAHFYAYGVGHGTQSDESHTGNDLFFPLGTTIHTPLPGVVRCVGNQGQGDWGQGCGSFADTITGGVGNVTVLTDAGLKLTFGHVNRALVTVGQRVRGGQAVATSGGMLSPHLHLDVSEQRGGTYWLLDPIPAIMRALGGVAPAVIPKRVPYDWGSEANTFTVTAQQEVTVYQRADRTSPILETIAKGDTFQAVAVVPGNDGAPWWLGRNNGRVPQDGTTAKPT